MVTHLTTNPPVEGLTCGEQTGSSVYPSPVVVCGRNYKKIVINVGVVIHPTLSMSEKVSYAR